MTMQAERNGRRVWLARCVVVLAAPLLAAATPVLASGGGKKEEKGAAAGPGFVEIDPVVVNFIDTRDADILQVQMQFVVGKPEAVEGIKANMPIVKNKLILLLSGQSARELKTREGKEMLAQSIRLELNKLLGERTHVHEPIDEVLFTSFVMQ